MHGHFRQGLLLLLRVLPLRVLCVLQLLLWRALRLLHKRMLLRLLLPLLLELPLFAVEDLLLTVLLLVLLLDARAHPRSSSG